MKKKKAGNTDTNEVRLDYLSVVLDFRVRSSPSSRLLRVLVVSGGNPSH